MSSPTEPSPDAPTEERRSLSTWLRSLPTWEKVALSAAVLAVAVGGAMTLVTGDSPDPSATTGATGGSSTSALGAGLVPEGTGVGGSRSVGGGTAADGEPTSKGVFRLGFSFLAGFCMGVFLRAVLKLAAIAVGFWLVMTFALSYAGLVVVDWNAIDALWTNFAGAVETEWGSFQGFMLGSLPATGLAVTGLTLDLRRR